MGIWQGYPLPGLPPITRIPLLARSLTPALRVLPSPLRLPVLVVGGHLFLVVSGYLFSSSGGHLFLVVSGYLFPLSRGHLPPAIRGYLLSPSPGYPLPAVPSLPARRWRMCGQGSPRSAATPTGQLVLVTASRSADSVDPSRPRARARIPGFQRTPADRSGWWSGGWAEVSPGQWPEAGSEKGLEGMAGAALSSATLVEITHPLGVSRDLNVVDR
jgi:hypothetical protein